MKEPSPWYAENPKNNWKTLKDSQILGTLQIIASKELTFLFSSGDSWTVDEFISRIA